MINLKWTLGALAAFGVSSCMMATSDSVNGAAQKNTKQMSQTAPQGSQTIVVAGGCFWCIEALFDELEGVHFAENGYAGGDSPNPTYNQVVMGGTDYAEAVRIAFDPKKVSGADLLRYFFALHDPTTLNSQGPDSGRQYRSAIFYSNEAEKALAEKIKKEIADSKLWKDPIVTTIEPIKNYSAAEAYHQDYFVKYEKASPAERMQMNAGYCSAIIEPKVRKFREKFAGKLKKKGSLAGS